MEALVPLDRPTGAKPLSVRVLGPVDVAADGNSVGLGGEKQRLVFAVLAARHGTVVSREALTDALWPSAPPASARHTLAAYVSRLRSTLRAAGADHIIEGAAGGYRLAPGSCELDRQQFEGLAAAGRSAYAAHDLPSATARFTQALDCWRGPAYTGLDGHIALRAEAAALNELRVQVLEQWGAAQLELGHLTELVRKLGSAVGDYPARERIHELLMTGLYRLGDQVGALRTFHELRGHLVSEFGLEPSAALWDLQRRILHHDSSLARSSRPSEERVRLRSAPVEDPGRGAQSRYATTLVGRDAELARINAALDTCGSTQRCQVVLVSGEPGVGKSRLSHEFAARAQATVLRGRSDQEQLLPLEPFVEALGRHASTCAEEELQRQVRYSGGELSRIVSDLPARVPGLAAPLTGDPDGARVRLFDAIERVLRAAAQREPVVMLLDDLHWADPLTLGLLKFLVRRLDAVPVLFVGTYRTTDMAVGHPLARTIADLRSECTPTEVALAPLGRTAIEQIVREQAGCGLSDRVCRMVIDVADGNPFFAVELVRHHAVPGTEPAQLEVPNAVREMIGQRLGLMDDEARAILTTAAALGRDFGLRDLRTVLGLDDAALADALDAATRAHLVREHAEDDGRYTFAHALTRETVYSALSRAGRAAQHRKIAAALKRP